MYDVLTGILLLFFGVGEQVYIDTNLYQRQSSIVYPHVLKMYTKTIHKIPVDNKICVIFR